jgi:predicted DNA-binding transcriptional regulator AlpA
VKISDRASAYVQRELDEWAEQRIAASREDSAAA